MRTIRWKSRSSRMVKVMVTGRSMSSGWNRVGSARKGLDAVRAVWIVEAAILRTLSGANIPFDKYRELVGGCNIVA
jgi:hypothetical protein